MIENFSQRSRFFRRILVAASAILIVLVEHAGSAPPAALVRNHPILNGDLSHGSGTSPDHWRVDAWNHDKSVTVFEWVHAGPGPGMLKITNRKPNDARWVQSVMLSPGWYRISAEIRTRNVGVGRVGANISVLEGGIVSPSVNGDSEWRRVGFYLKVEPSPADVEIACRLGGFGSLNTGTAWFRQIRVEHVPHPLDMGLPRYDLTAVRRQNAAAPVGSMWTLWATVLVLVSAAVYGWKLLGETVPPDSSDRSSRKSVASKPVARAAGAVHHRHSRRRR